MMMIMAQDRPPTPFEITETDDGKLTIRLSGPLNIKTASQTLNALTTALKNKSLTAVTINLKHVSRIDDYGALVLYEIKNDVLHPDTDFHLLNPPDILQTRVEQMAADLSDSPRQPDSALGSIFILQTGEATIGTLKSIKEFIDFIGAIVLAVMRFFKKPKSLRTNDIISYMKTTGVDGLPVVAMISFLIGLIMAFMSSIQLKQFGANIYVASLVALSMVSELGPIMTAIIVSGRSGSAYAAEISTMKISEEIDALVTMGFDPVLFLAIPRMIAAIIVIPLLTMFANLFAIFGGLVIGITMLDLSASSYINQTLNSLNLFELFWGLSKSFVFAIIISGVGCLRGFQAKGGASAVGQAATSAVVTSIFLIVLFDSIFAVIRSYWN